MSSEEEQPFATATIARIYTQQGKLARAREILGELISARPDDEALRRQLAEIDEAEGAASVESGGDRVRLEAQADGMRCSWSVGADGLSRARRVLGEPGRLILRIVGFPGGPESALDTPLERDRGALAVTPPPGSSLLSASVGLAAGGRYVSIAHSDPIALRR